MRDSGFRYGRTTEDLHDNLGSDPFQLPVTLHFYPRRRFDVARSFVREERHRLLQWRWVRRLPALVSSISKDNFAARFRRLVDRVCERGGVFHVWGHSWEIDRVDGWAMLDEVLRYAAERVPPASRLTNEGLLTASVPAGLA